ncbi:MAG: recombination protein RecR [Candidatus Omnitrophica bacterium]|nr:recombination protein RecR [Candidatus Omnitrophota bacterium]
MIKGLPGSMTRLIEEFSKMPGIGTRSAKRLTFYILQSSREKVETLLRNIKEVKENVRFCSICNNLSEKEICSICSDETRDSSAVCVVAGPSGVIAMEKTGAYKGLYHVLLGEISPLDGMGPEDLKIKELVERINKTGIKEVIIATDFTTEGETTALYLQEVLNPLKIKVTRLARGVPAGGSIEYADVSTLERAFEERGGV